ncbi:MAG: hypothetical protein IKR19_07720 [Acholeplasmatales bacterium]|nr:hypothetical protein [Acholeplasmatales bacterium]
MARVVKNTDAQQIVCEVITTFTNGSTSSRSFKVGDIVEGLRYIENETLKTVTGKVTKLNTYIEKVTKVNTSGVVDNFSKDVTLRSIVIDASEQYSSKLVTVNPREIVEDEGVVDVARVDVVVHPIVTMDIEYTDGTIANQELEIGDVLTDVVVMSGTPGTPDITGDFRVGAFNYTSLNNAPKIIGAYLVPIKGGVAVLAPFKNFIKFDEKAHADINDPATFISDIYAALESAEDGVAYAQLGVDVEIPKRDDGKITAIFVEEGQTLNVDLNGHSLDCQAYAFYVAGGTLNISDTTGNGGIKTHIKNVAYPAVMCLAGGTVNMDSGLIDTTHADLESESDYNWTYGVVCSGDGVFNMTGGKIKTAAASGISITNGTASGEGAQFILGGDSVLESESCAAIYLADNKRVVIKDNARIKGGMVIRMGDIQILDHAVVEAPDPDKVEPLGEQVMLSGVACPAAAFLGLTGIYKSALGNDMTVFVAKTAKLIGLTDHAFDIATINTKYDQKVDVVIENPNSLVALADPWYVYNHDELAEIVTRDTGKTLAPETNTTDLKITVAGEVVYPVVDDSSDESTEG